MIVRLIATRRLTPQQPSGGWREIDLPVLPDEVAPETGKVLHFDGAEACRLVDSARRRRPVVRPEARLGQNNIADAPVGCFVHAETRAITTAQDEGAGGMLGVVLGVERLSEPRREVAAGRGVGRNVPGGRVTSQESDAGAVLASPRCRRNPRRRPPCRSVQAFRSAAVSRADRLNRPERRRPDPHLEHRRPGCHQNCSLQAFR
jgi:hypothetical protein